jgi:hypothetical protein
MAQAVSRRLLTVATSVRSQIRSCGICGRQTVTAGRFSPSTSVSPECVNALVFVFRVCSCVWLKPRSRRVLTRTGRVDEPQ